MPHRLTLSAQIPLGSLVSISIDLDRIGTSQQWILPASRQAPTDGPDDAEKSMRRRTELAKLASKHLNKKLYLDVYADGPTRTLRISETASLSGQRELYFLIDLTTEIRQLEAQLHHISRKFIGIFGALSASRQLDLYGMGIDPFGATIEHSQDGVAMLRGNQIEQPKALDSIRRRGGAADSEDDPLEEKRSRDEAAPFTQMVGLLLR